MFRESWQTCAVLEHPPRLVVLTRCSRRSPRRYIVVAASLSSSARAQARQQPSTVCGRRIEQHPIHSFGGDPLSNGTRETGSSSISVTVEEDLRPLAWLGPPSSSFLHRIAVRIEAMFYARVSIATVASMVCPRSARPIVVPPAWVGFLTSSQALGRSHERDCQIEEAREGPACQRSPAAAPATGRMRFKQDTWAAWKLSPVVLTANFGFK